MISDKYIQQLENFTFPTNRKQFYRLQEELTGNKLTDLQKHLFCELVPFMNGAFRAGMISDFDFLNETLKVAAACNLNTYGLWISTAFLKGMNEDAARNGEPQLSIAEYVADMARLGITIKI